MKIKRGLEDSLPQKAKDGELLWTKDTKRLFIGNGLDENNPSIDEIGITGLKGLLIRTSSDFSYDKECLYLATISYIPPYVFLYKRTANNFTTLSPPGILPTGLALCVTFYMQYLVVGHYLLPYITIYKRTGDTFTKLANPAILPTSDAYGACFTPDGLYLIIAHILPPYITIYKRTEDTFTKELSGNSIDMPTKKIFFITGYLIIISNSQPYILLYKV